MKKFPLTILSIILIGFGWYQEVFYYHFVFTGNGLSKPIALMAGISLSLLLGYFSYKRNYVLFSLLLLFSIVTTVIGQNHSYSEKQNTYSIATVRESELTESKQYYKDEIQRVNSEIATNNNLLPDNISDRAYLQTNGVKPIKADIAILKAEKKVYEDKLENVSNNLSTGTKENTAFENLAKDIPFLSPTLLKYGFQVLMSLFIALMAPSGITILSTTYAPVEKPAKRVEKKQHEKKKEEAPADNITEFANERFRGEENPPTLKGRSEVIKNLSISSHAYGKMIAAEKKYNLVRTTGNMTIPNVTRSEYVMYMRNGKSYSGQKLAVL